MSTYTGSTPSGPGAVTVPSKVSKFYSNFYAVSDDPSSNAHDQYVDSFTPSGTLIMGTRKATGSEELMALRKGLWAGPVQTRLHTLEKIFPWNAKGDEVMLYGHVKYGLKNGKEVTVEWAGRAELEGVDGDGEVRMKFYQVYLDSKPVADAVA